MIFILLLHLASSWDYRNNGTDWPGCQTEKQSPIKISSLKTINESDSSYWYLNIKGYQKVSFDRNFNYSIGKYLNISGSFGEITRVYPNGSVNDTIYSAEFILFHTPSEHKIIDNQYDLEVQIHHRNSQNEYLVISSMFNRTDSKNDFNKFLNDIIDANSSSTDVDPIDINKGVYRITNFYSYNGSLTYPNCSNAEWVILSDVTNVYGDYIDDIIRALNVSRGNNRALQNSTGIQIRYFDGAPYFEFAAGLLVMFGYLFI